MRRTYELALVVDPRLGEEEAVEVVDQYRQMVIEAGAEITKEESWGKRKLAYPINKLTEGYYTFIYIVADGVEVPVREIEFRLTQNESVLALPHGAHRPGSAARDQQGQEVRARRGSGRDRTC